MAFAVSTDFPVFDGIAPSWADFSCKAKGSGTPLLQMKDLKEINTDSQVEIGEQRGASGGRVMRRTTGSQKLQASWTLYHSGWTQLLRNLKDLAPRRGNQYLVSLVHFDIVYQWTPPGGSEIFETRVYGARVIGRTLQSAEGTDATELAIPLSISQLSDVVDGKEFVLL